MQSGIDTTFMPVSGGPDVVRLDGVHARPLLHGYSDRHRSADHRRGLAVLSATAVVPL